MNIIQLLEFEEGWRETAYVDSEGYPTIGYGFLLGPKIPLPKPAALAKCKKLYTFTLPKPAGEVWLIEGAQRKFEDMCALPHILKAVEACRAAHPDTPDYANPRICVLISMAFQMGVEGLADFVNTLRHITNADWFQAETGMLKSKWATQTPNRARRHARQMRTGEWAPEYQ